MSTPSVPVRDAGVADVPLLLAWRNDPEARRWSPDDRMITQEEHLGWLSGALDSPAHIVLVGQSLLDGAEVPIGSVRFTERAAATWEVSIAVDVAVRGRRLAGPLLRAGLNELGRRHGSVEVTATVHERNIASIRLFTAAGFEPRAAGTEGFVPWHRRVAPDPT